MEERRNDPTGLGSKKISTLLKEYAVPAIIAMAASSLYNMIDSMFIGHINEVGTDAIAAIAVSFPFMNVATALGTLVGVGASTIVSVYLGQRNYEAAQKALSSEICLNIILGLLFTILTLPFLGTILYFFGASDNTIGFAKDYMTIIIGGNCISHLYFGLNAMIRVSGNPKFAMGLTIFTVVLNAVLDPLFIYGAGMGIQGAAVATILCQAIALVIAWRYLSNPERVLHMPKNPFKLDRRIAGNALAIGMGPFLMHTASCMVSIFINHQLIAYGGDLAIGAYGIANRISMLFIMITLGMNQAVQPIAGFNFGARQYRRTKQVLFQSIGWATVFTTCGFIVSFCFGDFTASLFTNDAELKNAAVKGLKWMNCALILVGAQIMITTFLQSLGLVKKAIFLSLSRQILILVPLIIILPKFIGEKGIWYSFATGDAVTFITSIIIVWGTLKTLNGLKDGDEPVGLGSSVK